MKKAMLACGFIILFSSFTAAREVQRTVVAQTAGSQVAIDVEDKTEVQNYKIYAVEIPGEGVTIKRVFRADQDLILLADNRDFPGFPRIVHLKGLDYNPICGRVVWTWNKLD